MYMKEINMYWRLLWGGINGKFEAALLTATLKRPALKKRKAEAAAEMAAKGVKRHQTRRLNKRKPEYICGLAAYFQSGRRRTKCGNPSGDSEYRGVNAEWRAVIKSDV